MVSKAILAVLALFCAMQTMEASVVSDLSRQMQNVTGGGLDKIESLIQGAVTKMEGSMGNVESDVEIVMDMVYQKLKEVIDSANTIGTDVSECTTEAEAKIRPIGQESEVRYKKCLQDIQSGINAYIGDLNHNVTDLRSKFKEEINKVSSCVQKSWLGELGCPLEKATAVFTIGQLGAQVPQLVAGASAQFPVLISQADGCSILVVMYVEKAVEPVIDDAEKCVKRKVSDALKNSATGSPAPGKDAQRDIYNGY